MSELDLFAVKNELEYFSNILAKLSYDLTFTYAMNKEALVGKYFRMLPQGEWMLMKDHETSKRLSNYRRKLNKKNLKIYLELMKEPVLKD